MIDRRNLLLASLAGLALPAAAGAQGSDWPSRPVRLFVPAPPGGSLDLTARLLQKPMQDILGQPLVVENKPGGAGTVATEGVVRAEPDGLTFGIVYTSHASNVGLNPKLPYDTLKDVSPIAFCWRQQMVYAAHPSFEAKTLSAFIELAKAKPGEIGYATSGIGSGPHLAGVQLEQAAKIRLLHVPYRGTGPAINDVLAGTVPILITNAGSAASHIASGKLIGLGASGDTRSPVLPDLPTTREVGLRNVNSSEWCAIIGPKGLPPAIVDKANAALNKAMASPEVADRFRTFGMVHAPMSPQQTSEFLADEIREATALIKAANIKAE